MIITRFFHPYKRQSQRHGRSRSHTQRQTNEIIKINGELMKSETELFFPLPIFQRSDHLSHSIGWCFVALFSFSSSIRHCARLIVLCSRASWTIVNCSNCWLACSLEKALPSFNDKSANNYANFMFNFRFLERIFHFHTFKWTLCHARVNNGIVFSSFSLFALW